jgi:hypothetical protein
MTLNVGLDLSFDNSRTGKEHGRQQRKLTARKLMQQMTRLPVEFPTGRPTFRRKTKSKKQTEAGGKLRRLRPENQKSILWILHGFCSEKTSGVMRIQ